MRCTVGAPWPLRCWWTRHCTCVIPPLFPRLPNTPVSSTSATGDLWLQHHSPHSSPCRRGPSQHPTKHTSASQAQTGAPFRQWSRVYSVIPGCNFLPEFLSPTALSKNTITKCNKLLLAGNLNAEHLVVCFNTLTAFEYMMVHFLLRAQGQKKHVTQTSVVTSHVYCQKTTWHCSQCINAIQTSSK